MQDHPGKRERVAPAQIRRRDNATQDKEGERQHFPKGEPPHPKGGGHKTAHTPKEDTETSAPRKRKENAAVFRPIPQIFCLVELPRSARVGCLPCSLLPKENPEATQCDSTTYSKQTTSDITHKGGKRSTTRTRGEGQHHRLGNNKGRGRKWFQPTFQTERRQHSTHPKGGTVERQHHKRKRGKNSSKQGRTQRAALWVVSHFARCCFRTLPMFGVLPYALLWVVVLSPFHKRTKLSFLQQRKRTTAPPISEG